MRPGLADEDGALVGVSATTPAARVTAVLVRLIDQATVVPLVSWQLPVTAAPDADSVPVQVARWLAS